ncbi:MAG TPA: ribosome-associated translation inhibitor RaiA [Burkholderiales bacterium]|nr:ribosome-associated translation inhibitor RaiA [Burkholderiales bacterium]
MQVPVQITIREMPRSEALETHIRQKAAKLEEFHERITSCRVTVEQLAQHRQQGRQFRVTVDVRVPGREIVANRDHSEDVYVALRDAFDAVKRQLEEAARLQRGAVKEHAPTQHGQVARLSREEGIGFIRTADGRELYFSRDNVVHPRFEQLETGASVQFIEEMGAEGPQAKRISVGKHNY